MQGVLKLNVDVCLRIHVREGSVELTSGRVPGQSSEPTLNRVVMGSYARRGKDGHSAEGMR